MKKEFIAHQGEKFTIEWYFDEKDKSIALDYYKELTSKQQDKFDRLFYIMAEVGIIRNKEKFRNEGDSIYAFKDFQDRLLCFFFTGSKIIITNAFKKKCDKLPETEKQRALFSRESYIKRCVKGEYYD